MLDDELIQIVGTTNKVKYTDVQNLVVRLGKQWYRRDDQSLVRIRDASGKLKFFRAKSPLLAYTPDGTPILKAQSVLTEDGIWLPKTSQDVVKLNNKYYRSAYITTIDGVQYLKSDDRVVERHSKKHTFILKKDAVMLSPKTYGQNAWDINNDLICEYNGCFYYKTDCKRLWNFETNSICFYPGFAFSDELLTSIVVDFQDKTNPQDDRVVTVATLAKWVTPNNTTRINLLGDSTIGELFVLIPTTLLDYFNNAITNFIMPRMSLKAAKIKEAINATYSDLDENENNAKLFQVIQRPFPGKQILRQPPTYPKPVKGSTFKNTGGIKYSFGVEIETSQGLLTNQAIDDLGVLAVGDRSVGSGEYVTPPLSGDDGLEFLKRTCEKLAKHTLVDDRCGIHVHVGTLFTKTTKKPEPTSKEAPSFSKIFLINAINLGALLEEELFLSMPKNRTPTLYHCHSIRRFAPVTEKNFDSILGAYIFGPKELWYSENKTPIRPFNFDDYKLGPNRNANTGVGQWAEGRYKWLNLIHSYINKNHKTIEFRIFSGSTSYLKIYAYVLTALAFTYVADNCPKLIKKGVTLLDIFEATFDDDNIVKFLYNFYEERKKRFNRKNLYPTNHPYLNLK